MVLHRLIFLYQNQQNALPWRNFEAILTWWFEPWMIFWVTLTENGFCEVCTKWASVTTLSERKFKKTQKRNSRFSLLFPLRSYPIIDRSYPEVTGHRQKEEGDSNAKVYTSDKFSWPYVTVFSAPFVVLF